jgi:hypothetical protein
MSPYSAEWVTYGGRPLHKHGFLIRQMFIARICKVLVLCKPSITSDINVGDFNCFISAAQYVRRDAERAFRLSKVLAETGIN